MELEPSLRGRLPFIMPTGKHNGDRSRKKPLDKDHPATKWFASKVRERLEQSGLGIKRFAEALFPDRSKCWESQISWLLAGKRGLTFCSAVDIANILEIHLGEMPNFD